MHIALDAHQLGKGLGGVERVVRMLAERLPALLPEDRFTFLINRRYQPDFTAPDNVHWMRLRVDDPIAQRSLTLPWLTRKLGVDLLHVQRIAPPFTGCRVIAHVHDLLPLTEPQDHRGLRDGLVRWLTPGTLRLADHILTVSETMKAEIIRRFPATSGKITAIPNGILAAHFSPAEPGEPRAEVHRRFGITGPYVYYLGAICPRKNLEGVVRGWADFIAKNPSSQLQLVISGMDRTPGYGAFLAALAKKLGVAKRIVWTGFLSDTECLALLRHARVFLAPSRGEGFDLPALEALACGVPVVCSDIPVHHELLAGCGLFFPHDEPAALSAAISRSESAPRKRELLIAAGRQRAKAFNWDASALGVAQLYRQLAPEKSRSAALAPQPAAP